MLLRLLIHIILLTSPLAGISQNVFGNVDKNALLADSLDLQARKFILKAKRDSARLLLEKSIVVAELSRNDIIIARCNIDMAGLYILEGKYGKAKEYIDIAWPHMAGIDHYDIKITGLLQRANYYNLMNQKDSSIYYFHAAEKFNETTRPYMNWVVYMGLGELFNQAHDDKEALKYFRKAYDITSNKKDQPDHIYVLIPYINYYMTKDKPDGAGELVAEYKNLLEERKKKNVVDPMQDIVLNLTNFRLEQNPGFMKAVKENSMKEGLLLQALIANNYIINYYERKKDLDNAISYATEGEEIAARTGGIQEIYGAKKAKYGLLQKAGKYKEANALAETLFELKDSMLSSEKTEQLYALETKFETERKEKEIELLTSKNELRDKEIALLTADKRMGSLLLQQQLLKQQGLTRENLLMDSMVKSEQAFNISLNKEKQKEIALNAALERENDLKTGRLKREKNLRSILIGGAVVLLLAVGVILFQYRRQRAKSSIIQKQSDDLQVLMKEIHHRVKNNLQVISSLLDLQSMTITDDQASAAVKEGKNRVQSMALIHQNLYTEGNIKGIKAKEYINNLLQSLCDSYNVSNEKVKVKTQIDDLNLDVDTMIPLGLVLNELVSNSLKYAFREGQQGELNILLKEEGEQLRLKVSDNGKGYPEGLNAREGRSFGMKMIRAFAQKLKARLDVYNDDGAVVEMLITKYTLA